MARRTIDIIIIIIAHPRSRCTVSVGLAQARPNKNKDDDECFSTTKIAFQIIVCSCSLVTEVPGAASCHNNNHQCFIVIRAINYS